MSLFQCSGSWSAGMFWFYFEKIVLNLLSLCTVFPVFESLCAKDSLDRYENLHRLNFIYRIALLCAGLAFRKLQASCEATLGNEDEPLRRSIFYSITKTNLEKRKLILTSKIFSAVVANCDIKVWKMENWWISLEK